MRANRIRRGCLTHLCVRLLSVVVDRERLRRLSVVGNDVGTGKTEEVRPVARSRAHLNDGREAGDEPDGLGRGNSPGVLTNEDIAKIAQHLVRAEMLQDVGRVYQRNECAERLERLELVQVGVLDQ